MSDRPKVIVSYDKVTVVHATAGPQGAPGVTGPPGPVGPAGSDATIPPEWNNPPDLVVLFENGLA